MTRIAISMWVRRCAAALALCATPASAHQGAVPMTFWGDDFRFEDARCQIEVGDGAARCGLGAWSIRRDCYLARLNGAACDEEADDDAIEQLRLEVFRGDIDPVCRQANLPRLSFSDAQDVQFDVVTFCRDLEAASVSVVFNPFFAANRNGVSLDAPQKQCIAAFADIATKAFRYGFRVRRGALDRIANRRRAPRVKTADIQDANAKIASANASLQAALLSRCSSEDFQALYGLTPQAAIELVASRSACLAERTYPVVAYECPVPVCGNGMRETRIQPPNERCDDGNLEPGDGCSPTCQLEF